MKPEVALTDAMETLNDLKKEWDTSVLGCSFPEELIGFCNPKNDKKNISSILKLLKVHLANFERKMQSIKTKVETSGVKITYSGVEPNVSKEIDQQRAIYWNTYDPVVSKIKEIIGYLENA